MIQLTENVRKDDPLAQRLSITRKKSATKSLVLVKSRTVRPQPIPASKLRAGIKTENTKETAKAMPFVEEEDEADEEDYNFNMAEPAMSLAHAQVDGPRSQPLRELPPQLVNSPEKRTDDVMVKGVTSKPSVPPGTDAVDDSFLILSNKNNKPEDDESYDVLLDENTPPSVNADKRVDEGATEKSKYHKTAEPRTTRLSESIQSLLDRRKEAPVAMEAPHEGRKRKERKLGRATSNMSNPSAPTSFMHSRSIEIADSTASASPLDQGIPLPSQQLGYEAIDAKEHRARMSKRMGTNFGGEGIGVRVESIGVVKDVDAGGGGESGVGNRVRGRHRNAKA